MVKVGWRWWRGPTFFLPFSEDTSSISIPPNTGDKYSSAGIYQFPVEMSASVDRIDGGKAWFKCAQGPMVLGEAPIYRSGDSTLHWVDALKEPAELHILSVDPESGDAKGDARVLVLEDSVSVHFFRKNVKGSYICAYYQGVAFMDEETGKLEILREIIPTDKRAERRFNDGGVDAKGRFWLVEIDKKAVAFGLGKVPESYGEPKGHLWRYDPDGSLHEFKVGVICGNGVKWSPDNKTCRFCLAA